MKKNITLLLVVITIFSINSKSFSQSVEEGDIQIKAYYGVPYFAGAFVKSLIDGDSAYTDIKATNTNHIGGGIQFLISEKIGLGVDYTFAQTSVSYIDGVDRYRLSLTKHRITALMSVHFANAPKIDPFFNVGAGYKLNQVKYTEPGYDDSGVVKQVIPVSMRVGIGLNYFFTDFLALNASVGLGGPLAQMGLTLKI